MAYTGVGSREVPDHILGVIRSVAKSLGEKGWILRSGGAGGCDEAFQEGAWQVEGVDPEIYLPWYGFNGLYTQQGLLFPKTFKNFSEAQGMVSRIHPNWEACSEGVRVLHTRNAYQVLGEDLKSPSRFLICWAKVSGTGIPVGGTRTAWVLAREFSIPCFNLNIEEDYNRVIKLLED